MKKFEYIAFTVLAMLVIAPLHSAAQSKKELRKENEELKAKVESLRKTLDSLQASIAQDSDAMALLDMIEENDRKTAAGLDPEDYNPDITDSLLTVLYSQKHGDTVTVDQGFDMDSVNLTSNLPDSVIIERLENLNSFITLPFNQIVRNYIVLFSEKMPTRMSKVLALSEYYMPIFEETFNKYGLPDELKYLAIVESALNPFAVSRTGAKGIWQFMYRAAVFYGLKINSYVDERLDPVKSVDAAARYLKNSYELFGDWNLAISSYNCGPGNVNKAIRRAGGKRDFWSVYDYLPRETRVYVPAFVGAMYAIRYSKEYGLKPAKIQMPPQVDTFEIHRNVHFRQISDVVGVPMEVVRTMNPQYIKDVIPGQGGTCELRLPFNYTNAFLENEDSVYAYKADSLLNPKTLLDKSGSSSYASSNGARTVYRVKKGDYLGRIARRYHVSVSQLKKWNHLRSDRLQIGQRLYIYGR